MFKCFSLFFKVIMLLLQKGIHLFDLCSGSDLKSFQNGPMDSLKFNIFIRTRGGGLQQFELFFQKLNYAERI